MEALAFKVRRLLVAEDGPTAVEYAVMLALFVIVCLTAMSTLGSRAIAAFGKDSSSLNQ
jgi:pilus assembly protein Flp/PilA